LRTLRFRLVNGTNIYTVLITVSSLPCLEFVLVQLSGLFQFAGVVPNIPVELDITNRSAVLQQVDRAKVSVSWDI